MSKPARPMGIGGKILLFFLGFIIGIIAVLGSIAGAGYWAYKNFSIQTLEGFGVRFGNDVIGSESTLRKMSIEELIAEFGKIFSTSGGTSINEMQSTYQLNFLNPVLSFLPPAAKDMSLGRLMTSDGLNEVMQKTNIDFVLKLAGATNLPAFVQKIGGKPISALVAFDTNVLLGDMYVGDVMGYTFVAVSTVPTAAAEKPALNGTWKDSTGKEVDALMGSFANLAVSDLFQGNFNMTTVMGKLDLGNIMGYKKETVTADGVSKTVWKDSNGQSLSKINETLAGVPAADLLSGTFDVSKAIGGLFVGDIMNYQLTDQVDVNQKPMWKKADATSASALENAMANILLSDMMGGSFQINTAFDGLYVGEVMGYTRGDLIPPEVSAPTESKAKYNWTDKDGSPVIELSAVVANIPMSDLLNGTFDASGMTDDIKLGDVISFDGEVNNVLKALGKDTPVSQIGAKIDTVLVGEAMGLYRIQKTDGDGNLVVDADGKPVYTTNSDGKVIWYNAGKQPGDTDAEATGIMAAFADLTVQELSNAQLMQNRVDDMQLKDVITITPDTNSVLRALSETSIKNLSTSIDGLKVSTVMDMTKNNDGKWIDKNGNEAKGIMTAFAELTVKDLTDPVKMQTAIDDIALGQIITIGAGAPPILRLLENVKVGGISTRISTMQIGEIMGLELNGGKWFTSSGAEATGIEAAFADLSVNNLNGTQIKSKIDALKVGDIFDTNTGIFALLSDNNKQNATISTLPTVIAEDLANAKMGKLHEVGIINDAMVTNLTKISSAIYYSNTIITDDNGSVAAAADCWKYVTMTDFFGKVADELTIPIP